MAAASAGEAEFERQAATLVERGYPRAAGMREPQFLRLLETLREPAAQLDPASDRDAGRYGFAIVVHGALVPCWTAIELVKRRGRAGVRSMLTAEELDAFEPIEQVSHPDAGDVHLIAGVENGSDSRDVTPDDALDAIHAHGRSPLTLDEGIALVTHFPEAVATNGGFSLAGSRCGDRRVTALWISKGAPKLGWCWAGNPHTWLGTASCGTRVGAAGAARAHQGAGS